MKKYIYIAYLTQAKDFLIAYKTLSEKFTRFTEKTNVKYFLLFHCAELAFKSYLIYKKFPIDKLKNEIGHNLVKVLEESVNKNVNTVFAIDKKFEAEIIHMNKYYQTKQFEYPLIGYKTYIEHYNFEGPLENILKTLEIVYRNTLS